MKRSIEERLLAWKNQSDRCPLIVRGARQVGKSYVIEKFGVEWFDNCFVANFEFQPAFEKAFDTMDPELILQKLQVFGNARIEPGRTLLFLDEIQRCPRALMALRYFKERRPDLHVIAAGSLLEFVLNDEDFSFPVGRVEFIQLRPMSFLEYLDATGQDVLLESMERWSVASPPDPDLHEHALSTLRPYLFVGGMPAVINLYRGDQRYDLVEQRQTALLKTYRDDFGKYARSAQHKYLQKVLSRTPLLVGKHFQYSKIDQEMRSRDLKSALEQLCHAGLLQQVFATAANGLPLRAEVNERKFKVLLLDMGLLQCSLGYHASDLYETSLTSVHSGALTEQFVGQELLAYSNPYLDRYLHFWEREKKSSSAEVDYVISLEGRIIPIEVKAGHTGRLRSLRQLMTEKKLPLGVRISEHPLEFRDGILSVPLYLIHALPSLIEEI